MSVPSPSQSGKRRSTARRIRRRLVLTLALALSATVLGGVVALAVRTTPVPLPLGDPGAWKLVFDDEFTGTSLDRSLWSTGWFGSGITGPLTPNASECFDPAEVKQAGGQLDLSFQIMSETCAGRSRPYVGAIVTTNGKFSFTYGFVEMRARLPGAGGVVYDWPDFWTDGHHWPEDGENDIVEGLQGLACWHFHSLAGAPGHCEHTAITPGWHTFGADWQPGAVTYYYDGTAVGTIRRGITGAPMYLIISMGAAPSNGPVRPATLRVSFVRVWQH